MASYQNIFTQVQLRGVTSIGSNSSPLYVVDGVIVSNDTIQGDGSGGTCG